MSAKTSSARGLSGPTEEQSENLAIWRAIALQKMPYFSRMLFSLRVVNTPGLGTYAVDANYRLYIDFDAVTEKGLDWNVESLLHECSHLFAAHSDLAKDMSIHAHDHQTWNYAADASINDDLVAAGCYSFLKSDPLPERFGQPNWKTAPFYFRKLKELMNEQEKKRPKPQSGQGQPSDDGEPGAGGQKPGKGQGQPGQGQGGPGDQQPFKGCGSGSGGQPAPYELGDDDDLGGVAPAASGPEKERIRIQTATDIKEHRKTRGTVPAGFSELAEDILTPSKTPWQRVLSAHLRRAIASKSGNYDVDHSRRSRRRHRSPIKDGEGVILGNICHPGTYEPKPTVEVIRDTSGSMSAYDLGLATREVETIARKVGIRGDSLMITDVDAEVHSTRKFTNKAAILEAHGRGGTSMVPGIEAAQDRRKKPTVIVVITDGYTDWPTEKGNIPIVAAIVSSESEFTLFKDNERAGMFAIPSFIKAVHIESTSEADDEADAA
jgi:predicted metal-dependent peptidase